MTTYKVECRRAGDWWALEAPDVPHGYSQARRLDQAEAMISDALAAVLGVDEDDLDIHLMPMLDRASTEALERMATERNRAEEAARSAAAAARKAAQALQDAGLAMRDAGFLMGISHQRVHQLLTDDLATRLRASIAKAPSTPKDKAPPRPGGAGKRSRVTNAAVSKAPVSKNGGGRSVGARRAG